ncbi:hypothetical protein HMPREF9347_05488 [Escherichia coli MS 124-1]|uniref:Uncharacterized protein n=1 Tax=Escherichia coli MS 85-1 TaxID=679202 RepID=A0AAN3SCE4_ECOLX|nr:hypothetical protein HMPREF9347_05488 [Escherichia coli MS 124-1]EFU32722.1 hypothetical protein HMPREF9350_05466 [Escherichia coli MS 85-1]
MPSCLTFCNATSQPAQFCVIGNISKLPPQSFRLLPLVSIFRALPPLLRTATICQQLKDSCSYVAHIHAVKLNTVTAHHLSHYTHIIICGHAVRLRGLFVMLLADSTSTAD